MANIFLLDGSDVPNSEDMAMLQALYSRSADSVMSHLEKVKAAGSGKFMSQFYKGYGHQSIGECGEAVLFFENVSILAAKAIQDFQLYQGQETSTRYIDFSTRAMYDPLQVPELTDVQGGWQEFYAYVQPRVAELLALQHPFTDFDEASLAAANIKDEAGWQRAINARSFDICRCFLPSGITTQLSWKTDLRKAQERLTDLRNHPCQEIRDLAVEAHNQLYARYPNSFHQPGSARYQMSDVENAFRSEFQDVYHGDTFSWFHDEELNITQAVKGDPDEFSWVWKSGMEDALRNPRIHKFLRRRPHHVDVPQTFSRFGGFGFQFSIDFGSFRDLQRHRSAVIPMPMVTGDQAYNGSTTAFHPWYLQAIRDLDPKLADECQAFVIRQMQVLERHHAPKAKDREHVAELQYYYPLGTTVQVNMYAPLPSAIYVSELRTTPFVHPTMRSIAHKMTVALRSQFPDIALYADDSPSLFNLKRGSQTILEK